MTLNIGHEPKQVSSGSAISEQCRTCYGKDNQQQPGPEQPGKRGAQDPEENEEDK